MLGGTLGGNPLMESCGTDMSVYLTRAEHRLIAGHGLLCANLLSTVVRAERKLGGREVWFPHVSDEELEVLAGEATRSRSNHWSLAGRD